MKSTCDVIVLGTGGVGSAALYHLAARGLTVVGLDQFPPAHGWGSSHGQSRIIRKAYFEHRDYVPLLERAYSRWDELCQLTGRRDLFDRTGLIQVGPRDGIVIPGVLDSAAKHGLALEVMTVDETRKRFPQYRVPEECAVVYEADAGLLRVEDCVLAYLNAARTAGATLHTGVSVHRWRPAGGGVEVETNEGVFRAGSLVVTAGSWAPQMLGDLGLSLEVRRKPLFWLKANSDAHRFERGCPCFFYERPEGQFYGFPEMEPGGGVKVACHSGGEVITDPGEVDRRLDEKDLAKVRHFTGEWFPEVGAELLRHETCLYTMSPDEHFIVDRHPGMPQVAFAAGLSGHGFKFASVLGEILSDLIVEGGTNLPAEFLGLGRFG